MRADFTEERRWRVVEACEFAHQIVEWHLSSSEEQADLMVGGRGWGSSNDIPIPGNSGAKEAQSMHPFPGSPEDDGEMLVGRAEAEEVDASAPEAGAMDATGAEVLDDILQKHGEEAEEVKGQVEQVVEARQKQADGDDAMGEDVDAEGEEDAEGEPDSEGPVSRVLVEVDGEPDAQGEEEMGEGVVGLDGGSCSVTVC